jgi:hypothetical protein
VSLTPLKPYSGVIDTPEIISAVPLTTLKFSKKILWLKSLLNFSFHYQGDFISAIGSAEMVSAVSLTTLKRIYLWPAILKGPLIFAHCCKKINSEKSPVVCG